MTDSVEVRCSELSLPLIAAGGLLAGIGFTMALFIANLAFSPDLLNAAKMGILTASIFSALAGTGVLALWSFRRTRAGGSGG
jgi:Na+:H+ antiporter, NhaA family